MKMELKKLIRIIENILQEDPEPIISVVYYKYDRETGKKRKSRCCGAYSAMSTIEGLLWLGDKGKRSREKENPEKMMEEIETKSIIAVTHLNVQDLIDNTNILYCLMGKTDDLSRKVL